MYIFAFNLRDECGYGKEGRMLKSHSSVLPLLILTSSSMDVSYGNTSILISEAWHHGASRQQLGKLQQKFPAGMVPAGCFSPAAGALLPKVDLHTGGCAGQASMACITQAVICLLL